MDVGALTASLVAGEISSVDISIRVEKPSLSVGLVVGPLADVARSVLPFFQPKSLFLSMSISLTLVDIAIVINGRQFGFCRNRKGVFAEICLYSFDLL
jgi:hypothetical protein